MKASAPDKSGGFSLSLSFSLCSSGIKIPTAVSLDHLKITSPTPLMGNNNDPPLPSSAVIDAPTHQLDLLLSLEVALELIHADCESLTHVETFGLLLHRMRQKLCIRLMLLKHEDGRRLWTRS
jgi:recyclin-1